MDHQGCKLLAHRGSRPCYTRFGHILRFSVRSEIWKSRFRPPRGFRAHFSCHSALSVHWISFCKFFRARSSRNKSMTFSKLSHFDDQSKSTWSILDLEISEETSNFTKIFQILGEKQYTRGFSDSEFWFRSSFSLNSIFREKFAWNFRQKIDLELFEMRFFKNNSKIQKTESLIPRVL